MIHARGRLLCLTAAIILGSCLDDLKAVGPGVALTTPDSVVEAEPGDETAVFAQVLDTNGEGVNGAYVTFTRTDESRVVWLQGVDGSNSVSVETKTANAGGIVSRGVARADLRVPHDAEPGVAKVVAVLKHPADPEKDISRRIDVKIMSSMGTGGTGSGGSPDDGPGGTGGSAGGDAGGSSGGVR